MLKNFTSISKMLMGKIAIINIMKRLFKNEELVRSRKFKFSMGIFCGWHLIFCTHKTRPYVRSSLLYNTSTLSFQNCATFYSPTGTRSALFIYFWQLYVCNAGLTTTSSFVSMFKNRQYISKKRINRPERMDLIFSWLENLETKFKEPLFPVNFEIWLSKSLISVIRENCEDNYYNRIH